MVFAVEQEGQGEPSERRAKVVVARTFEHRDSAHLTEKLETVRGTPPVNLPQADPEKLSLWGVSMRNPKVRSQLTRLLRKTLIFAESSEAFRAAIVDSVFPAEYSAGQAVFRYGQEGAWLGILIRGRLERKLIRHHQEILLGDVGPGAIIGDLGLFGVMPTRSFTVTALTSSAILVLTQEKYYLALASSQCPYSLNLFNDAAQMDNFMADTESFLTLPCFQGLSKDFVMTLRENSEPRVAYTGQVLMKEHHIGDEMYILRAGSVRITRGDRFVVDLPAGVVLGELAVMGSDNRRTATVTCNSLCLIRALHADVFKEILKRFPQDKRVFDHAYVSRLLSVEISSTREEVQGFNTFFGCAQPKTTDEIRELVGSTIKIDDKRMTAPKTPKLALPPLTPRKPTAVVAAANLGAPAPSPKDR